MIFYKTLMVSKILGVTHLEFLHRKNEPQRAQSSRKDSGVFNISLRSLR